MRRVPSYDGSIELRDTQERKKGVGQEEKAREREREREKKKGKGKGKRKRTRKRKRRRRRRRTKRREEGEGGQVFPAMKQASRGTPGRGVYLSDTPKRKEGRGERERGGKGVKA